MKILLMIFSLLFVAPAVQAQDAGFFIPQKTLDIMQKPDKLAPLRMPQTQPAAALPANQANNKVAPTSQQIRQPMPKQAARPAPQQTATRVTSPQPAGTANSARNAAGTQPAQVAAKTVKPRPADEPMIPQTGTPAIPVTADDVEQNSGTPTELPTPRENTMPEPAKAAEPQEDIAPEPTAATEHEFGYDDIINEYKQDIQKISQNKPAENERLSTVLKKYHDEVLIF